MMMMMMMVMMMMMMMKFSTSFVANQLDPGKNWRRRTATCWWETSLGFSVKSLGLRVLSICSYDMHTLVGPASSILSLSFDVPEASVYGKRDGYITGLSVISKENQKSSIFRNTSGWKTGCVHDVEMLGRSNMFKPDAPSLNLACDWNNNKLLTHTHSVCLDLKTDVEVASRLPHLGRAFTDVQELKQA